MSAIAQAPGRPLPAEAERVYRVQPARTRWRQELAELWQYRELLFFLTWRDIKVRYTQTALGVTWAILQPLLLMLIFATVFGRFANIRDELHTPPALLALTGLLPWLYFASCLQDSSTSIVLNAPLVTKVYFPRLIVPLSAIVGPVIDFLLGLTVLVGLFLYYGRAPHWHAVVTPLVLGLALTSALGVGLWLSALNVRYRDIRYVVPFLTQLWLFASPVAYPLTKVPSDWRWLFGLNPMTGVVDSFRWAVLGRGIPQYHIYLESAGVALVLVLTGLWYFKRVERYFADVI